MTRIKKTAALFLVLLFFAGCNKTAQPMDFSGPFDCTMTVKTGSVSLTGKFSRSLISCYTFQVTAPVEWAGLTFETAGGNTKLSFDEIVQQQDESFMPTSFVGAVASVLDDMARSETKSPDYVNQEEVTFRGSCQAGAYTVTYDRTTKNPVRLTVGDGIEAVMEYE